MNKHKRNLESLRQHLGRDKDGLALLDAVARDITALRKRVAALDESEASAVANADSYRVERNQAEAQLGAIKAELGAEKNRRACAEAAAEKHEKRIAELDPQPFYFDVVGRGGPLTYSQKRIDWLVDRVAKNWAFSTSSKSMKFCKATPTSTATGDDIPVLSFVLEEVTRGCEWREFSQLGAVMAFFALCGATVELETKMRFSAAALADRTRHKIASLLAGLGPEIANHIAERLESTMSRKDLTSGFQRRDAK